ncbi:alpha/beta-hydrolase [Lyophyllum atratum]|nr:alpha/beta-hydrolase [Lyophyllum atratum]
MVFAFRKQPLKTFYLIVSVASALFLRLPYWVVSALFPSNRPRRSWSLGRTVVVRGLQAVVNIMYDVGLTGGPDPNEASKSPDALGFVWVKGVSQEHITGRVAAAAKKNNVKPETISGYWYGKRDKDGRYAYRAKTNEKVIYYFHGGGHVSGSSNPRADSAPIVPVLLEKTSVVERAFALEYRLSSAPPFEAANPFPASLIDAIAGYKYLIDDLGFSPKDIIVQGSSSGGHLALALVLYLSESGIPALPVPGGLLLISPTLDWAGTHDGRPASSMQRNLPSDIVDVILKSGYSARALCGALPQEELASNPYLSPASLSLSNCHGLFKKFPRTCIVAGDAEQTLDAMVTFRDRLVADIGHDSVLYLEYPDAIHGFTSFSFFEPQRSDALRDISEWLAV